jgi:pimeloyl-ACP methyl ester carboxylesterase
MRRFLCRLFVLLLAFSSLGAFAASSVHAGTMTSRCSPATGISTWQGELGGANYTIQLPSSWNGTLFLYNHGYIPPFQPLENPVPTAPDDLVTSRLLQEHYALAASSYSQNGTVVGQALQDDMALLDYFEQTCGHPTRTIAWGGSMGGMISAALVQEYPQRFAGAAPACGLLSGTIGYFNAALDSLFALNVLLAQATLPLEHIPDPSSTLNQYETALAGAQQTPQGRARIALLSALQDVPGWADAASPEPAATDYATREANQYQNMQSDLFIDIFGKAQIETQAGGNPFWNTGVDFFQQLLLSSETREVVALYKQAGLSLQADLETLQHAPRISADPQAVSAAGTNITFDGNIRVPVLTIHTIGDPTVPVQNEQTYAKVVRQAGNAQMLRQLYIKRAGHCSFTDAEILAGLATLTRRIERGFWDDSTAVQRMNQEAASYGPVYNVIPAPFSLSNVSPAFVSYQPAIYLRPYTA